MGEGCGRGSQLSRSALTTGSALVYCPGGVQDPPFEVPPLIGGGGVQRELVLSLMTPGPALSPIDGKGRGWAASFPPPCHHVADEGGGVLSAALSSQD